MGFFDRLFGTDDLIVRDKATGEVRTFATTDRGYAEARDFQRTILERGHEVVDDRTDTLKRLDEVFGPVDPRNKRSSWF